MRFVYIVLFTIYITNHCKAELYNDKDGVNIFNKSSFYSKFHDIPNENWFVQFYHSYCGHCINFAPIFKSFINEAKHWNNIINFGVVDCSEERELCNNQSIKYFPYFKVYPSRSHNNSKINGITLELLHDKSDTVFKEIIEWIESNLNPKILHELKELKVQKEGPYFLVSGNNLVNLKRTVLTYYNRLRYDLYYRHAENQSYNLSFIGKNIKQIGVYPDIKSLYNKLNKFLKVDSNVELDTTADTTTDITTESTEVTKPENVIITKKMKKIFSTLYPVYNQDVFASIIYALRNEMNDENLGTTENLVVLKNFLVQLYKFSGLNNNLLTSVQTLIRSVENKIGLKSSRQKIILTWKNMMKFAKFPVLDPLWIGCNGSKSHFRRYPCGLWTTFHVMTVNQYIKSRSKDLAGENPADLIKAIREFIITFFSCRECAENFDKETFNYENSVKTEKDAVLYIWRVHNQVNKRIAKTYSEDPEFPKIAFPPESICPKCYLSADIEWPTNDQWNEEMVFKYLIQHYSKINVIQFNTQSTLMVKNSTWILTGISSMDISVCMLLSIFCTLIVIASFLKYLRDSSFFRKKRTRRKSMV